MLENNDKKTPWWQWAALIIALIGMTVGIFSYLHPLRSGFSMSSSSEDGSVQQGYDIQATIKVGEKGIIGYEEPVSLSATGQPSGVLISFSPERATPSYISTMTIKTSSKAPVGDYQILIHGLGLTGKECTCKYILAITPPPKKIIKVQDAFAPGGWMGDWGDITLNYASRDNPHSEPTCIKITYSATRSQGEGWAGIYWQYPDKNWGDMPEGRDLTGATFLTFWAKGENGGEAAEFKVGGITGRYPDSITSPVSTGVIILSNEWQQYTIDLSSEDLSHVIGGFCWVTNIDMNPKGCTVYLDDIVYDP